MTNYALTFGVLMFLVWLYTVCKMVRYRQVLKEVHRAVSLELEYHTARPKLALSTKATFTEIVDFIERELKLKEPTR
jgi:hypothetical protein